MNKKYIVPIAAILVLLLIMGLFVLNKNTVKQDTSSVVTPTSTPSIVQVVSPTSALTVRPTTIASPVPSVKACAFLMNSEYYVTNNSLDLTVRLIDGPLKQASKVTLVGFTGSGGTVTLAQPSFAAGATEWRSILSVPENVNFINIKDACQNPSSGGAELVRVSPFPSQAVSPSLSPSPSN